MSQITKKTAATSVTDASKPTKDADGPTQPIRTNQSPAAQATRHAHPALLLALFAGAFPSLVANPVSTMRNSLPIVLGLQAAYTIVCLPAVGSHGARTSRKSRPGEKKKAVDGSGSNLVVTTIVAAILSIIAAVALHITLVLFGAPFLTHIPHTFLCSLHLSLLGLYPLFYARGVSARDWVEIVSVRAPIDEAFGGIIGASVGAWLGAVPIPLDWDREWQKWPVTILCGIYAGYAVGKLVGGTLAYGKRFGDAETA